MKRLNIGLMISNIDNDYTSLLIKGVINAARDKDVNIIIYPGRGINETYDDPYHTEYEFQNHILYEYISKDCLDGVILSAGTVLSWMSKEERLNFVRKYKDLPILILENEIEGYPLIRFSSRGIKEAISYLIKHCGRKKIGFVGGTRGNAEAEERLICYKETLREYGLPVSEDYIVYGDFSEYCTEIVGELLDRHKGEIDALCFANDNMCIGGYKALAKRGLIPGKDVAVTGYDDSEVALSLTPLLTTVKADAGRIGYEAVENILKIIEGEKIDKITLDSTLIVRESSGECIKDVKEKWLIAANKKKEYVNEVEHILKQNMRNYAVMKATHFTCSMRALFIRLIEEINEKVELDLSKYFGYVQLMWQDNKESDIPVETLGNCIKELKKYVLALCTSKQQKVAVSEIIMKILGKAYDFSITIQISKRAELVNSYFLMNNIKKDMLLSSLTGSDNEGAVYESILRNLHRADFKSSYLYIFKEPFVMHKGDSWKIPDKLYLKAYHEGDLMITLEDLDQEIEWTSYLERMSENQDRQRTMILCPIYSNEEQHGLFLCELDFEHFTKVNFVTHQLSYAIKQTNLLKQLENYLKEIEVARHMAEKASEAKANFLANMSHEIRTPINSVLGMNEMILRESQDLDIIWYAQTIKSAGKTLLSLINDILDFSKIESGKLDLILADYEIFSLINDLVNMISERAEKKNLKLKLDFPHDLPSILYGDEIRLKQVIMNLLTNAVKYTDEGTVTFGMKWHKSGDFALLEIFVEDTGRGIKEEDLPKIFHEFERIEEKRNKNIEGTGLGMSITKQLLELMESQLNVESIYGKGSKFSFVLKQKIIDESPIGSFASRFNVDEMQDMHHYGTFTAPDAHILVVDDNAMNLLVVKSLLKVTKIDVDTADSGFSWIEKMKYNRYDVVFVDHMMPDMDGIEALQKVKKMQSFIKHPIPIIVLTANAIAGAREKYMGAGFTDYLSKPIDSSKLEQMLIKYLPKHLIHLSSQGEIKKKLPKDKSLALAYNFFSINVQVGLHYSGNDIKSYKKILKAYLEEGKKKMEILHKAFLAKDKKQYMISIHTLKSTSQNVGAEKLAAKAEKMEFALKEDDWNYIMHNHETVCKLYDNVLEEIGTFYAKSEVYKVKKSISKKELMQTLKDLKDKIYNLSIVEAVTALELLKDCIYEGTYYDKQAQILIDMLKDYDVETADEYLSMLLESLTGR